MTGEVEHDIEKLRALLDFIDHYPLPREARERMTYREVEEIFEGKRRELGLDFGSLDRDDERIQYWIEQIGISEDERGLTEEQHHMDLPLNFSCMPEYEPMLEAETRFWEQRSPGPIDTAPLFEIVRQYAPQPAKG